MMKQTLHALGALTIAAALTMLSTACTNDDNLLANEPQASAVKTYTVSIPATMAGDETRAVSIDGTTIDRNFNENEKVYVYNVTKDGLMDGFLQPTDISADGKSCTLTGELSDYAIEANDELKLMYNQSHSTDAYFYYISPNGSKESLLDGAVATVTVSSFTGGVLTTTANASFLPVQSMFRFKFVDENSNAITVKTLKVESAGYNIAATYWPISNNNGSNSIVVTPSSPTSDYLYMAMHIIEDETPTELKFTVIDNNDKEYVGTRTPPTGGFKNGKYYYNTEPIQLTKQDTRVAPTITWTSVKNGAAVSPDAYNCYSVLGPLKEGSDYECNPAEITISGTSNGYYFHMGLGGTVHLNNLTATYDESYQFIYSNGDLNLDINGSNSITVRFSQCIYVGGTLKLSGNGTLTVTSRSSGRYGIYGSGNYNDNNSDPAVLPAEGYTVTRSDRVNSGNGYYTLIYTVAPVKPTITWTNPSTPVEPDNYQSYYITVDNVDIALSGTSNVYSVMAAYSGTMRLNGLNATFSDKTDKYADFIYAGGNLNLVINGNNTINCKGQERCVFASGTLKLSGNGTLTVTSDENQLCGILGNANYQRNNNNYSNTGVLLNVTALAANGYTVTRSARQSNGDGTYTWTYTVAPVNQ